MEGRVRRGTSPSTTRRTAVLAAVLGLLLGLLPAAFLRAAYEGDYPYRVTATVGMVADIVSEVAGDRAQVHTMIGAGVDPHVYNPTRSDIASLSRADMIFYSGLLLEGQMADVLLKMSRRRPVYAVTELISTETLISDPAGKWDPHVWMDVGRWMKAAEAVKEALSEFDPPHASLYAKNFHSYAAQLRQLDEYAKKTLATVPEERRVMITAHDAFSYLGEAYGLEVLGIQGLSTESEAGLEDINRLVRILVDRKIPAVFVETSVSDKNVRALIEGARANGHEVRIGGSLFSDAMGSPGTYEGTYVGMIDHNVTTIARALGGQAPAKGMLGKLATAD